MTVFTRARIALLLAGALGCVGTAGRAEGPIRMPAAGTSSARFAIPLAAHRATYKLTLLKSVGNKSPTSADGRMSYEFTGSSCEGYSQIFRQVTEMQPAEGATRLSDMRSATFEDGEGKNFSFDVKTTTDNSPPDVVDGNATKKKSDLLAIRLSKPNAQSVSVDDDVLFPTTHLRRIIAAARSGQRLLEVKVFDGSDDGKKIYDTTAVIGHPIETPAADNNGASHVATMETMRRWPVTIAYFELSKKDDGPTYTLGFELYENGVSRELRFDYGDFVLAGELRSLEMLPSKGCRR